MILIISFVLMYGSTAAAIVFGGRTHRRVGILLIVSGLLTPWLQGPPDAPQWGLLALDVATSAVGVALLLRHRRLWLMVLIAFLLMNTATHVAVIIDPRIGAYAYLTLLIVWSYVIYLSLIGGVIGHQLRMGRRERAHSEAMARELIAYMGAEAAAEADRLLSDCASQNERLRARGLVRAVRRLSAT